MKITVIEEIVNSFATLPGIGQKSAERIVYALLQKDKENIKKLANNIEGLTEIKRCNICNSISMDDQCDICLDDNREAKTICVLDDVKNVWFFENNNIFRGKYFILSNLINPIQGIDVSTLNLEQLSNMIKKFKTEEILLALKPSIEGETTALYISKIYKDKVKVTRMAQGIPLGADIEYLDPLTLEHAMRDRKEI